MSARLYLTVYARDDMLGDSLGTVDAATELEYTDQLHGTGDGRVLINRYHPQAALLVQDRYVRVHSDAGVIGAFFLEEGKIDLSSKEGTGDEWIEWIGRGPLAILESAVMDNDSDIVGGHDPIDGFWDLSNQGPLAGDSSAHPITMFKRAVVEAKLQTPTGLGGVTHSSFTYDEDSNGDPLAFIDGEWGVNVGDDLLTVLAKLDQIGGVTFRMSPDFELTAWLTYGEDRSGAFGAGNVRFEQAANIAAAIDRKVRGGVTRTHLIVGGADRVFVTATDPDYSTGDVIRWGFLSVPESSDEDALEAAGLAHIEARKRQTDAWIIPAHDHGDDEAAGIYEPGDHYAVGDTVSVHTGSDAYDANEITSQVASITWELKHGDEANGDYQVRVEIGSTFHWSGNEGFDRPGSQHSNAVTLCQPGDAGTSIAYKYYFSSNTETALNPLAHDAAWANAGTAIKKLKSAPDGTYTGGTQDIHNSINRAVGNLIGGPGAFAVQITGADLLAAVQAGGMAITAQVRCKARHGIGVSEASQNEIAQMVARVYRVGTGFIGTMLAAHSASSGTKFPAQATLVNRTFSGTASAVAGAALNDWIVWEGGARHLGPTSGASGAYWAPCSKVGVADLPEDQTTSSNLNTWVLFSQSGVGATDGDLPLDTVRQDEEAVGEAPRAARCDHQHAHGLLSTDGENYHGLTQLANYIFHSPAAPTVSDDEDDGYVVGTHWIDGATGDVYILTDATVGAAVWEQINGGGGSYTDEQAQDAVGGMIADTATVNLTYTDATPELKADVLPAGIKLDDLGTPDDNTDLDASTSAHGLLKKLGGGTSNFLRADGTWAAPAGGGSGGTGVGSANLFVGSADPYEAVSTSTALGANTGFFFKFCPSKDVTVSQVIFRVAVQSGNLDFGIYDDALNRLVSTGSFGCPAVPGGGFNTQAFSGAATQLLEAGKVYFLAMVSSSATFRCPVKLGTGGSIGTVLGHGWKLRGTQASALPLPDPATPTFDTSSTTIVPIFLFA